MSKISHRRPVGSERALFKYAFRRDTLFATISVFITYGLLSLIPLNTHLFDPVRTALSELDYNDLVYSEFKKHRQGGLDTSIIIVDVGHASRPEITEMLRMLQKNHPKVIGTDIIFRGKQNEEADNELRHLLKSGNVVAGYELHAKDNAVPDFFRNTPIHMGYLDFTSESQIVVRSVEPFRDGSPSFSAAIVELADKAAYQKLQGRENHREWINYDKEQDDCIVIDGKELITDSSVAVNTKDKIVLLGYLSPPNDIEDKHYTPANEKISGKSLPDMNGVVIHANIISMMLKGSYISETKSWVNFIIAFLLCWVHMTIFINFYIERHIWFHLVAKIAQLLSFVFFVYIDLLLYYKADMKINLTATLAAIALAVDVLYFFESGVIWLKKKIGYKTVFHHDNH